MVRRVVIALVLVAAGAGAAALVFAAFIVPHQAIGTVNTAVSGTEALYICQPTSTIVSPQCPVDTGGADEVIFAGGEDLLAGSVEWQKIRVTNVGAEPWDVLSMTPNWTETSDPGGLCTTIPEAVRFTAGTTSLEGATGPGVTVLGKFPASGNTRPEPVESTLYGDTFNDNHFSVSSSANFQNLSGNDRSIHVQPADYEDLLLGIRLPIGTPEDCLNVVWTLTTTWEVQTHIP